jgi:hypothetical protein
MTTTYEITVDDETADFLEQMHGGEEQIAGMMERILTTQMNDLDTRTDKEKEIDEKQEDLRRKILSRSPEEEAELESEMAHDLTKEEQAIKERQEALRKKILGDR